MDLLNLLIAVIILVVVVAVVQLLARRFGLPPDLVQIVMWVAGAIVLIWFLVVLFRLLPGLGVGVG